MQQAAVEQILNLLPQQILSFNGSQYPNPIQTTFLGYKSLDLNVLRKELLVKQNGPVTDLLEPLLLAAETVEAAQEDNTRFFITDHDAQGYVFMGSKWQAGWVLVLGDQDQGTLITQLLERSFMVFTDQPDIPDTIFIGDRPTSPIYFLQLMVRYGLIWGRIAPGDDHEMGHFLEKDMPGLIIITQDLSPLKYLVTLGLLKLGAPAIVPSTFPFPYGYRREADNIPAILDNISQFTNLRQRYFEDEIIRLPAPCNRAVVHEKFPASHRLGGGADSFFCVQPTDHPEEKIRVIGQPSDQIGIHIGINAALFNDEIAAQVEKAALRGVNTIPGVRAYEKEEALVLEMAEAVGLDTTLIGEAIYAEIRSEFPRLKNISTTIIFDPQYLHAQAESLRAYKASRRQAIASMTEANTDQFCACIECRPFSLVHTCILTPERPPMCGARSYASAKSAAFFGSDAVPYKRPSEKGLPMRKVFSKGELLDPDRGEYSGVNLVYQELTGGQLRRVYLHSVRDYPLTSCGCFQALAFWLPEVAGIGIMSRNSPAVSPDGFTWDELANRAGGKQSPGIVGVSYLYMHSPSFLKGDGGISNVVWVDKILHGKIHKLFSPGQRVAIEEDVKSIEDLATFLKR